MRLDRKMLRVEPVQGIGCFAANVGLKETLRAVKINRNYRVILKHGSFRRLEDLTTLLDVRGSLRLIDQRIKLRIVIARIVIGRIAAEGAKKRPRIIIVGDPGEPNYIPSR